MFQFTFERGLLPLNEKSPFAELFQLPPRYTRRHDFPAHPPRCYHVVRFIHPPRMQPISASIAVHSL